jgi:hypothetical protein
MQNLSLSPSLKTGNINIAVVILVTLQFVALLVYIVY